MKSLSLTINRIAQWKPRIAGSLSRRDGLSVRRRAEARAKPKISSPPSQSAVNADSAGRQTSAIARDVFHARLACPSQTIRSTKQTTFQDHSISTTQLQDGMWVAAFGRLDGEMMETGTGKRAVLETSPHEAEAIAIAEAQIQIEERGAFVS